MSVCLEVRNYFVLLSIQPDIIMQIAAIPSIRNHVLSGHSESSLNANTPAEISKVSIATIAITPAMFVSQLGMIDEFKR
jgi:hypothetical protein